MEMPLFCRSRECTRKNGVVPVITQRTTFRGFQLRVNTVRVMICAEILFFSDLELRRCYFLTIRYLKTKAL